MNIIRELREEKGISVHQLAKYLRTSRQNIINWEKGTAAPSEIQLRKIANFFNVEEETILSSFKISDNKEEIKKYILNQRIEKYDLLARKIDNESDLELKGVIEKPVRGKKPKSYININQVVNNAILVLLFISTIIFSLRSFSENITAPQEFNLIVQKLECSQEKCIYKIVDKLNSKFPNDYIELQNIGDEKQYFVRLIKDFNGYKIIEYSVIQI